MESLSRNVRRRIIKTLNMKYGENKIKEMFVWCGVVWCTLCELCCVCCGGLNMVFSVLSFVFCGFNFVFFLFCFVFCFVFFIHFFSLICFVLS